MVRIESIALSQLGFHIGESVKALRGHGVEIGGLVVGHFVDSSTDELVITGFIPVEIAYSPSPIFQASQAGFRAFEQAIAGADGKVIGYFRSQIHNGFAVREGDRSLIARFPAKDCCFVGIVVNAKTANVLHVHRVLADGVPTLVESFTLDGEELHPAAVSRPSPSVSGDAAVATSHSSPEFPQQRANSAPVSFGNLPSRQDDSVPNSAAVPNVPAPRFAEMAAPPARRWNRVLWSVGGIAVAVALAFTYVMGNGSAPAQNALRDRAAQPVAAKKGDAGLKLHATQLGDIFEISWDASSPAVLTSAEGALAITGVPPIRLAKAQLRVGQYFYKPAGNSLAFSPDGSRAGFSLMIYQADGSVISESGTFGPGASEPSHSIPGDTDTARSQQLFSLPPADPPVSATDAGSKLPDRQIDELRTQIPTLIESKRWADAEKRIANLEKAVPGDSQAAAWRKAMTSLRAADLIQNTPPKPPARSTPVPAAEAQNQPHRETPPAVHEEPSSREIETPIASLHEPAIVPMPVEPAIPPPSLLNPASPTPSAPAAPSPGPSLGLLLSPRAPTPAIVAAPAPLIVGAVRPTPQPQMFSLIRTIAGRWTFSNLKARRPRITNGFQFAPEIVSVDVNQDGSGSVYYQAKPGIWHVAETSVQFQFRLTDWNGLVLAGKSEGDKEYSLTLEPDQGNLNLVWHSLNRGGKLHVSDGEAALTRSSASAAR